MDSKGKNTANTRGRREFIASLGILGLAGVLPFPVSGMDISGRIKTPAMLAAGPYLQYAGPTGITIRWITLNPCSSWVEYGETSGNPDKKAESVNDGLADAYNTLHAITLDGLIPGKKYFYRICSKSIEKFEPYEVVYGETFTSSEYSFETICPQKKDISFLVFNDIHDRPESFGHLMQFRPPVEKDFLLMNGDIFGHLDSESQIIKNLLEPLSGVSPTTPIIFSRGNHETRGIFARHLGNYFNHGQQGYYFSFIAGPVYCIVLDSGEDKPDDDPEYFGLVKFDPYRLAQREWMKKEMGKKEFKKAKYRLVFSHIPPFYSGDWHGTTHCREVWADIFNEAKIDVLISGHTHVSGIHPKVDGLHNYPIVIGGGPKDGARTIIEVEADEQSFRLKLIDDSGKVKGELKI